MDSRNCILILALLCACGCGQAASAPPPGPRVASIWVTRDYGKTLLRASRATPGQEAIKALERTADVSTAYGGRFVQGIDGLKGDQSRSQAWLYLINGVDPGVGAGDYTLHPGDVEWWDYRYWANMISTSAAIGAWPEPFLHGFDGHKPRVEVGGLSCAGDIAASLRQYGVHTVHGSSPYSVQVATFANAPGDLGEWQGRGLTVALRHDQVLVYHGARGMIPDPSAHALIAAYSPTGQPISSVTLVVAGDTEQAACAAADLLAHHPSPSSAPTRWRWTDRGTSSPPEVSREAAARRAGHRAPAARARGGPEPASAGGDVRASVALVRGLAAAPRSPTYVRPAPPRCWCS